MHEEDAERTSRAIQSLKFVTSESRIESLDLANAVERKDKCRNPGTVLRKKPDNTVKGESDRRVKVDEKKQTRIENQKKKTSEKWQYGCGYLTRMKA